MTETITARRRLLMLTAGAWLSGCGGSAASSSAPSTTSAPPTPPTAAGSLERVLVPSRALGRDMPAVVYTPPGYDPSRRYPLLYLLHGYGGNEYAFFNGLGLHGAADRLIAAGAIGPLLIVTPACHNSFGVNTAPGQAASSGGGTVGPYEDYLIGELLPFIEARLVPQSGARHIGGVSMGGFAALHLALRHPNLFSRVGAHSAALWNYSAADQFLGQRNWLYATPALRSERDPMLLAATVDLTPMRFYLDVGASDGLRPQDEAMHAILLRHGAASTLKVAPGGHDGAFWNAQLPDWLRFYAAP